MEEVSAGAKSSGNLRPLATVRVQWTGLLGAAQGTEGAMIHYLLYCGFILSSCFVLVE